MNTPDSKPERQLWQAVIIIALNDLQGPNRTHQKSARQLLEGPDLNLVGDMAGLEPDEIKYIRQAVTTGKTGRYQRRHDTDPVSPGRRTRPDQERKRAISTRGKGGKIKTNP